MVVYKILWYFVIYSFFGWCLEVASHTVTKGVFINRGFLNGPYCPIYGVGASVVILLLEPIAEQTVILFIVSAILCSALEWITGWVLEHLFHNKWWDYSDRPFNLNGYICLEFSLGWGAACVVLMKTIQPLIEHLTEWSYSIAGGIILGVILAVLVTDAVFTVLEINDMNSRFKRLEAAASDIRKISDDIGLHINDATLAAMEAEKKLKESIDKSELPEMQAQLKEKLNSVKALREKYAAALSESKRSHKRLLKAFPSMSGEHKTASDKIRAFIKKSSDKSNRGE